MKSVKTKIILDLCGGTGAWSQPYREAGYDVRVVTLPECDVCNYKPPARVHGILASPPCTEFSIAKGNRPRDFATALQVVKSCLEIIWRCRLEGSLAFWCLENPTGFLRQFLGVPPLRVRYWWFGDNLNKPTDLWGYYKAPKRICAEPPAPDKWNTIKGLQPIQNMSRAAVRSKTPPGFAKAFFNANR